MKTQAATRDVASVRATAAEGAQEVRNVYVHVPFCARRCVYCDFAVHVDRSPDDRSWLAAIGRELKGLRQAGAAPLAAELDTLYVGGGTPSLLGPRAPGELARRLGPSRMTAPGLEWTMEANPESFTPALAEAWAGHGVNRISFGVQSFDRSALAWMGRLHEPAAAEAAVSAARSAGVSNLSVDLLFGLPAEVRRCWRTDLERALALGVPHVSLYGLTVEPGTALARQIREGRTARPGDRRYRDEYLAAAETLAAAGYEHYEVSNFALPGFRSRHNQAYWDGSPYLGLGNGAHSHLGGRRLWNERDWQAYAGQVAHAGGGRAGEERLDEDQRRLEAVWLSLRTRAGLDVAALGPAALETARGWVSRGLGQVENGMARLTPEGWLQLDGLAVELDAAAARARPARRSAARPPSPRPVDAPARQAIF